ncbi:MAG: tRNA (guanine(10)-N(2))-dimethyltransferase [Methanomicrobiales archaeon]|nr:tRNA (guanine(10)-N(2))-dimethyltransferase [Methanomicrobiales archaeon]
MELRRVREGSTSFLVPVAGGGSDAAPQKAPIFYNPSTELNRDATILLLSVIQPSDYVDAMGASGVRGLRAAKESGLKVLINDHNPLAAKLIDENARSLGIACEITRLDVNALLSSRHFDAVDLDPFGSPAPFADSAIRAARRFLFVTATDTAPLCGAHLKAGMRRYFSSSMNTEYHAEVGIRNLLGFVAREALKYDRGIEPLFCFAKRHYVRLHLRLQPGVRAAERTMERFGYILQCPGCPSREEASGILPPCRRCPHCGGEMRPIGPLWLGGMQDRSILEAMGSRLGGMRLGTARELSRLLALCRGELDLSYHFDYHNLARYANRTPPPAEVLLDRLMTMGFKVCRTHYSGTAIKTDAPFEEIIRALSA